MRSGVAPATNQRRKRRWARVWESFAMRAREVAWDLGFGSDAGAMESEQGQGKGERERGVRLMAAG
jgi:hypothetical protein